jgi:hypothetical protein
MILPFFLSSPWDINLTFLYFQEKNKPSQITPTKAYWCDFERSFIILTRRQRYKQLFSS